jgi:glycosyltransferase involved in cell wall biosynthesis
VYNEETVVQEVVNKLTKYFTHVVCINDASTDASLEELNKTSATVLSHEVNKGSGAALRTGINYCIGQGAEYFVTFDADGQHRLDDAIAMVKYAQKHPRLDIVMGSRFMPEGAAIGISLAKRMFLKCAVVFSNLTTGIKLTDTHNGLRVFNRRFAIGLKLRCNGMAHASEFMIRIAEKGYKYEEYPVTVYYTDYSKMKGQSMFNTFNIIKELYFTKS